MSHAMSVRAASFATSAALLAIIVVAAFSVTITLQPTNTTGSWTFPVFELPQEPPPPPPTPREQPPQRPVTDAASPVAEPPPLPRLDLTGTPTDLFPPVIAAPEITNPRWVRQPRDLARYYPSRALARGETGQVLLECRVDTVGALHCSVISETPEGWGFGDAALRISEDYRMVPAMRDGQAVEGRYRMRVPFEVR